MYQSTINILQQIGLDEYAYIFAYAVCIAVLAAVCIFLRWSIKHSVVKILSKLTQHKKILWIEVLLDNNFFTRLSNMVIPITVYFFISAIEVKNIFLSRAVEALFAIIVMLVFSALIKSVGAIYNSHEVSKTFPIHSLLQVVEITVFVIGSIVVASTLVGKSPTVLLSGIGAMTAITSIIFKDAILGFVAGIQLTGNDMIRIGDWIEMPKHLANGTVVYLSMTTVTVENFDKTTTMIPAYTLISEAFINWRGMSDTGARRIKRSIYIDATGVRICDDAMINRFKNIALLQKYINDKLDEIEHFNSSLSCDLSEKTNGRRLTNIGVFRAYITEYLKHHPGIHKGFTLMVRQLEPGDTGIPLEIYTFVNNTEWIEFENIQSDIFDHLYAVVSEFGLSLYQNPSGNDIFANVRKHTALNNNKEV